MSQKHGFRNAQKSTSAQLPLPGLSSSIQKAEGFVFDAVNDGKPATRQPLADELLRFHEFGQPTRKLVTSFSNGRGQMIDVPTFVNEFWTARQRQASSLHEVSYRACFKPQLPRFFIERLTRPGEIVYDPFMGRGTTPIESALLNRVPVGNDANPLSVVMTRPRLNPPTLRQVETRLRYIRLDNPADMPEDLLAFYHPETLCSISSLKNYLLCRRNTGALDAVDEWLELLTLNRLTGHSPGFFSVYTLPPQSSRLSPIPAQDQRQTESNAPAARCREDHFEKDEATPSRCRWPSAPDSYARVREQSSSYGSRPSHTANPSRFCCPDGHLTALPRRCPVCSGQLASLLVPRH